MKRTRWLMVFVLALGTAFGLAGSAQAEDPILTFSDLAPDDVPEDYQPSELDGTGVTTTWTGWSSYNDDVVGKGMPDHTQTWYPEAPPIWIFASEGSIGFSQAVEVPSIWIYRDSAGSVVGRSGGEDVWSVAIGELPWDWAEITEGAGHLIDEIVVSGIYDRIDDITVVGSDPLMATNPRPKGEEVDPEVALLEWDAPAGVCTPLYDVYFGTDSTVASNPKLLDNSAATSVEPNDPAVDGSLAMDTQYYWRVDVNDPNCNEVCGACVPGYVMRTGAEWTFTTWPPEPLILTQPENSFASPGGTVEFTVESGGNLAGNHTFTWYKQVGATRDEPNDVVKKGPTGPAGSDTLTLNNVVYDDDILVSDEAPYYCKVTNTAPGITYSDSAALVLLRLMAWYELNGNYTDSASTYIATNAGAGMVSGGVQGFCMNLNGSTGYAYVPFVIAEAIGTLEDFTIAAWVNPDVGEEDGVIWAGYDDTEGGPPTGGDGLSIERTADGGVIVRTADNTPATVSSDANAIPAAVSVSEVQTSTLDALMTSGTFTMTYNGQTTAPIAYNATKAQITAALNLLSTVSPGNIKMQNAHEPDTALTCTWTFTAVLDDVPMLSMDVTNATPTTSADFVETMKGENHWTYVVFVYDSNDVTGTGTLYINGEPDAQVEYSSASARQIGPFSMGAYLPDGGSATDFFDGKMDDVRIYAYAITPVNVASLYNEMTFDSACAGYPEFDQNDSCTVELVDYAMVLSNWLGCNIVPTCLP